MMEIILNVIVILILCGAVGYLFYTFGTLFSNKPDEGVDTDDGLPIHKEIGSDWFCNCFIEPQPLSNSSRVIWDIIDFEGRPLNSPRDLAYSTYELMVSPPKNSPNFYEPESLAERVEEEYGGLSTENVFEFLYMENDIESYFTFGNTEEIKKYLTNYAPVILALDLPLNIGIIGDGGNDNLRILSTGLVELHPTKRVYPLAYGIDKDMDCLDGSKGAIRIRWNYDFNNFLWSGGLGNDSINPVSVVPFSGSEVSNNLDSSVPPVVSSVDDVWLPFSLLSKVDLDDTLGYTL